MSFIDIKLHLVAYASHAKKLLGRPPLSKIARTAWIPRCTIIRIKAPIKNVIRQYSNKSVIHSYEKVRALNKKKKRDTDGLQTMWTRWHHGTKTKTGREPQTLCEERK
jgi:hypothetical protein